MSTRCKIRVKGKDGQLEFYNNYDAYPEGVGFDLVRLLLKVKDKEIPAPNKPTPKWSGDKYIREILSPKYSAYYEFGTRKHGDLDYVYTVDTDTCAVTCYASPSTWRIEDVEEGEYDQAYDMVSMYRSLGGMEDYEDIKQSMYEDYLVTDKKIETQQHEHTL